MIITTTTSTRAHRPGRRQLSSGPDGEEIVMDAGDFCRVISGRPGPEGSQPWGLLTAQVSF
jgi:hypothetical protein